MEKGLYMLYEIQLRTEKTKCVGQYVSYFQAQKARNNLALKYPHTRKYIITKEQEGTFDDDERSRCRSLRHLGQDTGGGYRQSEAAGRIHHTRGDPSGFHPGALRSAHRDIPTRGVKPLSNLLLLSYVVIHCHTIYIQELYSTICYDKL